jgi:toxin ParE1/3/4
MSLVWAVRLAAQAEKDFSDIVTWTVETFGRRQAEAYTETLTLALEALHNGPELLGSKARHDIEPGIRTLHIARQGRKGRHFVVFRETQGQCIDVLRILHDSMDLARHIPAAND